MAICRCGQVRRQPAAVAVPRYIVAAAVSGHTWSARRAHRHSRPWSSRSRWGVKGCACAAVHDAQDLPALIPAGPAAEIEDPGARAMLTSYRSALVRVPGVAESLRTAYVGPALHEATPAGDTHSPSPGGGAAQREGSGALPPFLLVHGFDSSALEWRRIFPRLAQHSHTYAIDTLGCGFTDLGPYATAEKAVPLPLGPQQIREHLFNFWRCVIQEPVVIVGASLGGTTVLDFALNHPEAVANIVLIDAQGYIDGIGPAATAPRMLVRAGIELLRSVPLRALANRAAYYDKATFATSDALRIGRLHTHCTGWAEAKLAFIRSGGYRGIAKRVRDVEQDTLLLWGKQDEILDVKYAAEFQRDLPRVCAHMLDECGHCAHLEQSAMCAEAILAFAASCGGHRGHAALTAETISGR